MSLINYIINQNEITKVVKESLEKQRLKLTIREKDSLHVNVANLNELKEFITNIHEKQKPITAKYKEKDKYFIEYNEDLVSSLETIVNGLKTAPETFEELNQQYLTINDLLTKWYQVESKIDPERNVILKTLMMNIPKYAYNEIIGHVDITEDSCKMQKIDIIVSDLYSFGDTWQVLVYKKGSNEPKILTNKISVKNCPETIEVKWEFFKGDRLAIKYYSVNQIKKTVYYNIEFFK